MDKSIILHTIYHNPDRDLVESNFSKLFKNGGNILIDPLFYTLCMDEKLEETLAHNKRMRPYLIWLSSNAAELKQLPIFWELSTVVELLHQSTLPADDIQDNSDIRCWRLALWKKVWINTTIDLILLLAASWPAYYAKILWRDKTWYLHDYSDFLMTTLINLVRWQELDLSANDDFRSIEDYFDIVDWKTWALINLSLHFWTMPYENLYTNEKSEALTDFSMLFARLYQICDDIDDIKCFENWVEWVTLDSSNVYYYVGKNFDKLNRLYNCLREELFLAHDNLKKLWIVKKDDILTVLNILFPVKEIL